MKLRPYQQESIVKLRENISNGISSNILVCPTGGGKTLIAAHIIYSLKSKSRKALFLVHRSELVEQAYEKFMAMGLEITVCKSGDKRVLEEWDVMIATVQTLINRELPKVDLVIVDECHLSVAPSWKLLIDFYRAEKIPLIGLTATPFRLDNKSLGDLYEGLVSVTNIKKLTEEKHLVPIHYYSVPCQGMKYNDLIHCISKYASGLKTIIFTDSIKRSQAIEKLLGENCRHIDAKMGQKQRNEIIEQFRSSSIKVLTNVNILSEGFDVPDCECIILERKTQSLALYIQQVGRGIRSFSCKQKCLVLDLCGNVFIHGLPQDILVDKIATPSGAKSYKAPKITVKICEHCFSAVAKYPCEYCGHVPALKLKQEDVEFQELVDIKDIPHGTLKYYIELAKQKGYKKGWAWYQWRSRSDASASTRGM